MVYDEGQPRGLWRLARVTELINSADGRIRAATVRVQSKTGRPTTLTRPIQHLYPLESRELTGEKTSLLDSESQARPDPEESTPDAVSPNTPDDQPSPSPRPTRAAARRAKVKLKKLSEQQQI